jgi:hypothetical protein
VEDERLTIISQLTYVAWFVAFFGALFVLVFVLAFLILRIPWVRRRADASNDRKLGIGQEPLFRQAHRTGVVPPGADIERWRAAVGEKDPFAAVQWIVAAGVLLSLAYRTITAPPRDGSGAIAHAILPVFFLALFSFNYWWMRRRRRLRRQLFQDPVE